MNFEDEASEDFEVLVDDNYPGQFRVVGTKIEKVSVLYTVYVCTCEYVRCAHLHAGVCMYVCMYVNMYICILCIMCTRCKYVQIYVCMRGVYVYLYFVYCTIESYLSVYMPVVSDHVYTLFFQYLYIYLPLVIIHATSPLIYTLIYPS